MTHASERRLYKNKEQPWRIVIMVLETARWGKKNSIAKTIFFPPQYTRELKDANLRCNRHHTMWASADKLSHHEQGRDFENSSLYSSLQTSRNITKLLLLQSWLWNMQKWNVISKIKSTTILTDFSINLVLLFVLQYVHGIYITTIKEWSVTTVHPRINGDSVLHSKKTKYFPCS